VVTETRQPAPRVGLAVIAGEWARIGVIGFGGPPAHIALLRALCVDRRRWLSAEEFEDGVASTNLLPGPASTQLAIFCAWRVRGVAGGILGGLCFIVPGLVVILALAALFLATNPPLWVLGAAAGAGAAVPAVALQAAVALIPASWRRVGALRARRWRWTAYFVAGVAAGALVGSWVVLVLIACGLVEIACVRAWRPPRNVSMSIGLVPLLVAVPLAGTAAAIAWVALKVGALSYGGGFVIIPLMQHDAVDVYRWMSAPQFLNAVALGQITPGPVVHTVAVVGYAAGGLAGGLLAATVAFLPSFLFVLLGGRHFDRLRRNRSIQAFLTGAGAAVIGAIAGSAVPLGLAVGQLWQLGILAVALVWLVALRRNVVVALVGCGVIGVVAVLAGAPIAH
jgi:chromate transporter